MSDHEERMAGFASRYPPGPPGKQGEPGPAGEPVPRRAIRAVLALFLIAAILGVTAVVGISSLHSQIRGAVQQNNHRWCATLQLLSAHPVARPADPAANPSRENAYVFYINLLQLRSEFGCS